MAKKPSRKTVLAVGADHAQRAQIAEAISRRGYRVQPFAAATEGLTSHREEGADLILLLLPLSDLSGRDALGRFQAQDPRSIVIVTGTDDSVEGAPEALDAGAFEYLLDPAETHDLLGLVGIGLAARKSDAQLRYLRGKDAAGASLRTIVGRCPPMRQLFATVRQVCHRTFRGGAPTILITGETGTGKGLIAKAIHYNSVRRSHSLVSLNCAAVPGTLVESELFGHEKGAFTDARAARPGLIETADSGTLFLDEVASLPLELQGKLLTVIEEKVVRRLGSNDAYQVDVQIVAATHRDLGARTQAGDFREDLYHRLNVIKLELPPLRDRGEDRILLAETFVRDLCTEYGIETRKLSADAKRAIESYPWPGNVRELRNHLERVLLLEEDETLTARHFQMGAARAQVEVAGAADNIDVQLPETPFSLDALEREVIRAALARHDGNISATARYLGLTRHTLSYRIKKHGLEGG